MVGLTWRAQSPEAGAIAARSSEAGAPARVPAAGARRGTLLHAWLEKLAVVQALRAAILAALARSESIERASEGAERLERGSRWRCAQTRGACRR